MTSLIFWAVDNLKNVGLIGGGLVAGDEQDSNKGERERETERERQTERETERQRDREREKNMHK